MWFQISAVLLTLTIGQAAQTPMACFNRAKAKTILSNEQAITLCRCATSTAPVDCYTDATRTTTLSPEQALDLCVGSSVYGPDCHYWGPWQIR